LDAPAVLDRAAKAGLLPEAEAARLVAAYRLFDDVHHWQRLMVEGEASQAPPAAMARLAVAMGLHDARTLIAQLDAERTDVRERFLHRLA
ncbi:hypothetical protein ACFQ12_18755, partial [Methylobacterium trifolii]